LVSDDKTVHQAGAIMIVATDVKIQAVLRRPVALRVEIEKDKIRLARIDSSA
jgi:hypothetical protein